MYGLNSAYRNAMPSIYGETWSSSLIPYTLAPFLGSQGTTKLSYLSSRLFRYIRKSYAFLALHRTMGACTTSSILSCQPPISSISALFHISDNDLGAAHSNRRSLQPRIHFILSGSFFHTASKYLHHGHSPHTGFAECCF